MFGLGLSFGSLGIGCIILRALRIKIKQDSLPVAVGLGLFLLTQLLIAAGLIGVYNSTTAIILLALLIASAIGWFVYPWMEREEVPIQPVAETKIANFDPVVMRIGISVLLIIFFINCMSPETRHDPYDYHLPIPTIYLAKQRIVEIPWHVFSYMPKNVEILYGFALAIGNDSLCKLIHLLFGCACAFTVATFTRRLAGHTEQLFAALLIVSLPLFGFLATSSYVDLGKSFWELLALYCLYFVWDHREARYQSLYLILSALFAGMALGAKYVSYLIFLPPYALLIAIVCARRIRRWPAWTLPAAAVALFAPLSVWFFTNWSWTGNPMYPLFPSIFGMHIPPAEEAYRFFLNHTPKLAGKSLVEILQFVYERIVNLLIEGNVTILIGLCAWIVAPWWQRYTEGISIPKPVFWGLLLYMISFPLFLLGADNADGRFFMSTVCALCVPVVFLFANIKIYLSSHSPYGRYIVLVLVLGLFLNALSYRSKQLYDLKEPVMPIVTDYQRNDWLTQRFTYYPTAWWANETLTGEVFIVGMGYPLRHNHLAKIKYGYVPFLESLEDKPSPARLAEALLKGGVTHIAKPFPVLSESFDLSILEEKYLERVYQYRGSTLFRLIDATTYENTPSS